MFYLRGTERFSDMINDKKFLFNSTQTLSINAGVSKGDENLRSNLIGRD